MFEDMTFEKILNDALEQVDDKYDKREGSLFYDAIAPACLVLAKLYIQLDTVLYESFADTQSRSFLVRRASERGLVPYSASYARVIAQMQGNFILDGGERFNLNELNYYFEEEAVDSDGNKIYILACETAGKVGNISSGTLIPMENISGLEKAEIKGIYTYGRDEEDTEDFRERYFESLLSQAFGGNVADYKEKVNAIDGVGAVKVFTATDLNDGGKVLLYIIDNDYGAPESDDLKELVQTTIDPIQNSGEGLGLAPVGHTVMVNYADVTSIDVGVTITFADGWTYETAVNDIRSCIDDYFSELNRKWESVDSIIVRISQIESRLLDVEGIIDVTGTTLNGSENNLILERNAIAKRGNINVING
jgi:uncharacterized phage protein gp47/JayE